MFKRVGKEIKTWAKVLVILQMIPVVIAGLAVCCGGFFLGDEFDEGFYIVLGIVVGILVIVLGYFLARLSAILLYAKGEAVDRLMGIDERLERLERSRTPAPSPAPGGFCPPAPQPYVPPISTPMPAPSPENLEPVLEEEPTLAAVSPAPPQMPREWFCPVCGQKNEPDGSWCCNCGTRRSR